MTWLDFLASEYGEPEYVKADAEGFEINVLGGISFRPRYPSFEFGVRPKEASCVCLAHMGEKGFRFRPIIGREYRFATPE